MGRVYRSRTGRRVVVRDGVRELHIDGTFASAWEPGRNTTGSVWDAIGAALLALPPARRRDVLLLGLGGGSAARVVRALAPRAKITAVEIDASVVRLAREWFDLDALRIELRVADARQMLARSRRRFDAVLEDVFVGTGRDAVKPDGFPEPALAHAAQRLRRGGILASNTLDEGPAVAHSLRRLFPRVACIEIDDYDNRVFIGGPRVSGRALRRAVAASPLLAPTLPRLRFRTVGR